MATLPTVKLINRKTGKKRVVNQTDYATDLAKWADWKIFSQRHGDASDVDIIFAADQADVERFRNRDATRQRWSGDAQRAFDQRKIIITV
tara:strand:- start:20 stop:289 length:270 start_codon:yes stop_codon:yes gene_type:complete